MPDSLKLCFQVSHSRGQKTVSSHPTHDSTLVGQIPVQSAVSGRKEFYAVVASIIGPRGEICSSANHLMTFPL